MLKNLIEHGYATTMVSLPRARHPLHVMPTSAGYDLQTSTDYAWDGRSRGQIPFTVFQHTIRGTGTLRYENRVMKVRTGETMLVIIPHNHRYWLEGGDEWEFFWISTHGREALRIHETVLNARGPVLKLSSGTVDKLAACCLRLINGEGAMPGAASAIAYEATMALFDDTFGPAGNLPAEDNAVSRAVQFISTNLDASLDVEGLAKVAGLSRSHFTRTFAETMGLPPAEYVLQERMKLAARLLFANRDLAVKEIAARAGIPDHNYFAKVFRRTYGINPTEFRTTGMYGSQGKG